MRNVWRLAAVAMTAIAIAATIGWLSACGQHPAASPAQSAVSASGSSAAAVDAQQSAATGAAPEASAVAPSDRPGASSTAPAGASDIALPTSPEQTSTSSLGQSGAAPTDPSGQAGAPLPSGSLPSAGLSASPDRSSAASSAPGQAAKDSPLSSPAASSAPSDDGDRPQENAVLLSVVGNAEWGTVLASETIALKSGDKVSDLLIRALKSHKLAYETRGAGALFYVVGIDGLFEFDDGPTSGWKYRVNGEVASISAGAYKPEPGDQVEWFYAADDGGQP